MRTFTQAFPILLAAVALVAFSACVPGDDVLEFELEQRSIIYLANFDITVEIGDIERGRRVDDVEVRDDGRNLAYKDTMHEGDTLTFEHEGYTYALTVVRLENDPITIGDPFPDDWGEFELDRWRTSSMEP